MALVVGLLFLSACSESSSLPFYDEPTTDLFEERVDLMRDHLGETVVSTRISGMVPCPLTLIGVSAVESCVFARELHYFDENPDRDSRMIDGSFDDLLSLRDRDRIDALILYGSSDAALRAVDELFVGLTSRGRARFVEETGRGMAEDGRYRAHVVLLYRFDDVPGDPGFAVEQRHEFEIEGTVVSYSAWSVVR